METYPRIFCYDFLNAFKSYYVVWKHFFKEKSVDEAESLNRTMQYGNDRHKIEVMTDAKV